MLKPLSNATYLRLFLAQVIALLGTGLSTVALALLAFKLAGADAGLVLGTALAIKMVAYAALAPLAGTLTRQLPRKWVLIGLDCARAAFMGCLPFVDQVWQVYVLIFLLQACSAGFTPAFQSLIPDVLKEEQSYTQALSLSRLASDFENLASPALAAVLLTFLSFTTLFALNAFAFLVSASLIFLVTLPALTAGVSEESVWQRTAFGLWAYLSTPRLRGVLALFMAVAAAGAMVIVNTVVYAQSHLGLGQTDTALLLAAFGAGSMAAALALPKLLSEHRDREVMLVGGVLLACGLAGGIVLPSFGIMLILWFVIGLGYSIIHTPAGRLLTRSSHEDDRLAYFAAHFSLTHACWLITYPLAGWLSSSLGLAAAFGVLCSISLAATALSFFLWPAEDPKVLEHTHEALTHEHLHVHDAHHQHEHEGWEGPEPHSHPHTHQPLRHSHAYVVDMHHRGWPG